MLGTFRRVTRPDAPHSHFPVMHLHALDIAIIVGYFVLVLCLGLWVSRKGTKDLDENRLIISYTTALW